ncbi:MAG: hypothetical protein ACF8PG_08435 [Maioricimonas sp. JB045]|uniref:hypothetical protein n=1 Tax=Maioricimonas sp. JC845 TaxID=3232138 RepID=UPI003458ED65
MTIERIVPAAILLASMLLCGCGDSGAADASNLSDDEQLEQQMQQVENEEQAHFEQQQQ